MISAIDADNEPESDATEVWKPSIDIPLSPEMRAAMLQEYDQALKDGRQLTNEEVEVIAKESTTTKSWGTIFRVEWIHV